ncbi:MAG: pectate lyase [Calditrichae bacterium]|nr:pectate lyase [Calditrichia bacterium]
MLLLIITLFFNNKIIAQNAIPEGFAGENTLGQNGTTGGAGGSIVTVNSTADFLDYIFQTEPFIIQVVDTIELTSMAPFRSNKTVVGVGNKGVITGSGLNMSNVSNIIIRNLLIENSNDDAINIQERSHHIWVDHCDLRSSFDGLLDIKRGSDYITVSWNTFSNHDKTSLIGHDDNNAAQDSGKFHVTYHHNWFNDTVQRHPRVRFSALAHIYNNYYVGNNYGVGSTMDANVLVESNYF